MELPPASSLGWTFRPSAFGQPRLVTAEPSSARAGTEQPPEIQAYRMPANSTPSPWGGHRWAGDAGDAKIVHRLTETLPPQAASEHSFASSGYQGQDAHPAMGPSPTCAASGASGSEHGTHLGWQTLPPSTDFERLQRKYSELREALDAAQRRAAGAAQQVWYIRAGWGRCVCRFACCARSSQPQVTRNAVPALSTRPNQPAPSQMRLTPREPTRSHVAPDRTGGGHHGARGCAAARQLGTGRGGGGAEAGCGAARGQPAGPAGAGTGGGCLWW